MNEQTTEPSLDSEQSVDEKSALLINNRKRKPHTQINLESNMTTKIVMKYGGVYHFTCMQRQLSASYYLSFISL